MSHANAALTPRARLRLARLIVDQHWTCTAAAAMFMVSPRTAGKWAQRYRTEGPAGMTDRSSRPHHSPTKTDSQLVRAIVRLRWRQRLGPVQIGGRLQLPASTVHAVLVRCNINRLSHIDRASGEPIRRYEHDRPGALIHVDVTKFGNIPDGSAQPSANATKEQVRPKASKRQSQRQRAKSRSATRPKANAASRIQGHPTVAPAHVVDIYRRYQAAGDSENPGESIDALLQDCQDRYKLTRNEVYALIDSYREQIRRERLSRANGADPTKSSGRNQSPRQKPQAAGRATTTRSQTNTQSQTNRSKDGDTGSAHVRARTPHLPPIVVAVDVEAVAVMVAGDTATTDELGAIVANLSGLIPRESQPYGYLSWRYAASLHAISAGAATVTTPDHLTALAIVVDYEKRQIESLSRAHGAILAQPDRAYTYGASRSIRIVTGVLADARKMTPSARPMTPLPASIARRRPSPSSPSRTVAVPACHRLPTLTRTLGWACIFCT